jgi:hypothetical protein
MNLTMIALIATIAIWKIAMVVAERYEIEDK